MKKYALILTVENEEAVNNKLEDIPFRFFEMESVNCVESWRKNAGWLKDIPIYIMNPTGDISEKTKEWYNKYNVTYISKKPEIFNIHEYGFFNVHYVGHYLEKLPELQDTLLIHIDLDMEILRPFPEDFFDDLWENKKEAYLGGYFKDDYKNQRKPIYSDQLTNTGFVCNIAGRFNFYEELLKHLVKIEDLYRKIYLRDYDKEEYCSDLLSILFNFKIINGYEQGEGYSVAEDLTNVYFWHEHLYESKDINLSIMKFKLKRRLNGLQK